MKVLNITDTKDGYCDFDLDMSDEEYALLSEHAEKENLPFKDYIVKILEEFADKTIEQQKRK